MKETLGIGAAEAADVHSGIRIIQLQVEWRLTGGGIELLRDRRSVVLELLQEAGGDGEEINTSQSFDLSGL